MKKAEPPDGALSPDLLRKMKAYWRAANYLSVDQICTLDDRSTNQDHLLVCGYKEEGATSTLSSLAVLNRLDRVHPVGDVIDPVQALGLAGRVIHWPHDPAIRNRKR